MTRVALIGANGHGRSHRARIGSLHDAGAVEFVGMADPRPVGPDPAVPPGVGVFRDHRTLLARARPDVAVICTPPPTHLAIALDAVAAGCDLLLEKPPVLTRADHDRLAAALGAAGRVCQVGFQALASPALELLRSALRAGTLGEVVGVAAVAAWQRDDAYYDRAPWAGRRAVDGALVNPLAHAVMQCLAVAGYAAGHAAGGLPRRLEVERYRTRPIESDDTAVLRLTLHDGPPVVVAGTLAGEEFIPGEVVVTGTRGRAVLEYPTDRLWLPGEPGPRPVAGRENLLTNLLAHRADPTGVALRAPLADTVGFTAVVEALAAAPPPVLLGGGLVRDVGSGPRRVRSIRGVNAVLRRAADGLALPSELGVPWARPAFTENVLQTSGPGARTI